MRLAVRPRSPIARRTDPATSVAAARAITVSGERDTQATRVLQAVREAPGRTSAELAQHIRSLDRYVTARRLPELEALGVVARGTPRRCAATGHLALTWWACEAPHQEALFRWFP